MKKLLERAKKQLKAAAIRAFQAATTALIATISGKSLLSEIDWGVTLSIVVLAALTAFVYGISCKLPECEESKTEPTKD